MHIYRFSEFGKVSIISIYNCCSMSEWFIGVAGWLFLFVASEKAPLPPQTCIVFKQHFPFHFLSNCSLRF